MLRLSHGDRAGQDAVGEDKELAVSGRGGDDTLKKFIQPIQVGIGKVAKKLKRRIPARWLERILGHELAQAIDNLIALSQLGEWDCHKSSAHKLRPVLH